MSDLLDVACLLIDHNNEVPPGEDVFLVYLSPVATVQSLKKEIRSSRSPVLDRVDPLRLVVWRFLDSDDYLQTSIGPEAREKVVRDAFMDRNRIKYVDVATQIQELRLSLRPKEVLLVQMPRVSDSITGSPALSCYQNVTDARSLDQYKDLCFEVTAWTNFEFQDLEVSGLDEYSLELPSPDFVDKLRRLLDAKPGMPPDEQLSAVFSSTFVGGRRTHFAPTSQPEPPQRIADTNEVSHTSFLERPWEDYWTENDGPGLTESFAGTLFFHTVYGMAYDAPCDVEIGTTTGSKSWTYPILVHNVNGTPGDQLRIYTPRSDFCISSSGLPRLIVEVQSGSDDGSTPPDYVLMLLCGAVVVRFANRFCGEFKSAKNFALVATYIRKSGKAEQFILFQRNNIEHKVFYIREAMLLQRPNPRIRYARMLRNFLHMLRREGGGGTEAMVHKYMSVVNNSSLKTLYHKSTNPNKRKRNAGDEGNQNNPAGGRNPADDRHVDGGDDYEDRDEGSYSDGDSGDDSGDSSGNDSGDDDDPRPQKVDIANLTERYIVHERKAIKIDRGYLKPIGQMPSNLKVVSRRSDPSKRLIAKLVPRLIAKFVPKRSGSTELEILRYIESRPSKSKNVISLLDFISPERGSGSWVILPQYPSTLQKYLDEVSLQGEPSSLRKYVPTLCWGLVSGLAFLHEQSVAHRDIKPSNVLLAGGADFQPVLIDFDCAVLVKNEEEKVADYCGTEGWMAPEVERKEAHSPIRADRWACGRFILHILDQVKGDDDELKAYAAKLVVDDPAERLQLGRWCKTPSQETAAEAAEVIPQRRPHETSDLRGHSATLG